MMRDAARPAPIPMPVFALEDRPLLSWGPLLALKIGLASAGLCSAALVSIIVESVASASLRPLLAAAVLEATADVNAIEVEMRLALVLKVELLDDLILNIAGPTIVDGKREVLAVGARHVCRSVMSTFTMPTKLQRDCMASITAEALIRPDWK